VRGAFGTITMRLAWDVHADAEGIRMNGFGYA
jgi:hypothetical protein